MTNDDASSAARSRASLRLAHFFSTKLFALAPRLASGRGGAVSALTRRPASRSFAKASGDVAARATKASLVDMNTLLHSLRRLCRRAEAAARAPAGSRPGRS